MMYSRFLIVLSFVLAIASPVARAESMETTILLTDQQIATIRANCQSAQTTITGIHSSDALARVHLGQEYETISTKYMAPMNSRVALAKLDGVELIKTTVEFNKQLDEFRSLYQQYEQTMLRAMQMKCDDQPVAFYDTINRARMQRAAVREQVGLMGDLVKQYRKNVESIRAQLMKTTEKKQ